MVGAQPFTARICVAVGTILIWPGNDWLECQENFAVAFPESSNEQDLAKKKNVITREPLVMEIKPSKAIRERIVEALRADPPHSVKLALKDVVPPAAPVSISVYLNLPVRHGADELSEDSEYWVGAIEFQPISRTERPESFNLDLVDALSRQFAMGDWSDGDPLRITLIAVPHDPGKNLPDDLAIPVGDVRIAGSR